MMKSKIKRGPLSRRRRGQVIAGLILLLGVVGVSQHLGCWGRIDSRDHQRYHDKTFTVIKVVDGDTFDLEIADVLSEKRYTRIRLWGVDTPETKHPSEPVMYYGPEASAFVKKAILHQEVKVTLEPFENSRGKYGRLLAYIYLSDGRMLNEELVRKGYAYADPRFRHMLRDRFGQLQKRAQREKAGLWEKVTPEQWPRWYQKRHGGKKPAK